MLGQADPSVALPWLAEARKILAETRRLVADSSKMLNKLSYLWFEYDYIQKYLKLQHVPPYEVGIAFEWRCIDRGQSFEQCKTFMKYLWDTNQKITRRMKQISENT